MIWKLAEKIQDLKNFEENLSDKISKSVTLTSRSKGGESAE